jgi:hypothetical protein
MLDDSEQNGLNIDWTNVLPGNDPTHLISENEASDCPFFLEGKDILVVDTGGGNTSTITKHACLVIHETNHFTELAGYQDK